MTREATPDAWEIFTQLGARRSRAERERKRQRERQAEPWRRRRAPPQPGTRRNGASTKLFEAALQMNSLWAVTLPWSTAVTKYDS